MTKFMVMLFSAMLIVVSLVGVGLHEAEFGYVVGFSRPWIIGRLVVAFFFLTYEFWLSISRRSTVWALRLLAVGLAYMGLSSLLWGSYAAGFFVPAVDILLAIEGSVVALLASIELPPYNPLTSFSAIQLKTLLTSSKHGLKNRQLRPQTAQR